MNLGARITWTKARARVSSGRYRSSRTFLPRPAGSGCSIRFTDAPDGGRVVRKLVKLAILLFIANALYRMAPVSLHYYQFKDALQELALFSQKATDAELTDRVMALADEHNVPL